MKDSCEKFDEFLIMCNTLYKEGETKILSRFRGGFRDDRQTELLVRGVNESEAAYALVQDLDSARTRHTFKSHNYRRSVSRPFSSFQHNKSSTQAPSHRDNSKGKSLERDNRNKSPDFSKVSSTIMCYKCQCYRHSSCPSLVRIIIINGTPTEASESDFYMYIFKGKDYETDEEPTSDDVGLNNINQIPSIHLYVVRCVPSQLIEIGDWRKNF